MNEFVQTSKCSQSWTWRVFLSKNYRKQNIGRQNCICRWFFFFLILDSVLDDRQEEFSWQALAQNSISQWSYLGKALFAIMVIPFDLMVRFELDLESQVLVVGGRMSSERRIILHKNRLYQKNWKYVCRYMYFILM